MLPKSKQKRKRNRGGALFQEWCSCGYRRERELEEYHKAVAIAEEAARLEAIAEAKRKEEEAAAERVRDELMGVVEANDMVL